MSDFGLIGEKLGHSISPKIHNMIFNKTAFEGEYRLYEISHKELSKIKDFMCERNLFGVNVTIPYKEKIMPFLDEISVEAKKIGAVNTVVRSFDKLIGYNTDYYGFGAMLQHNKISVAGKDILVLGNGGASKAVVTYFLDNGANNIYIASRTPKESTLKHIRYVSYSELSKLGSGYIIVNATPVGMYPNINCSPVDDVIVQHSSAVVDLIYNPARTEIIKKAQAFSKPSCNGLYMLVGQAVKAQEIWRGDSFSIELTNEIYQTLLKE